MAAQCEVRSQSISLGEDGVVRTKMRPNVFELELADAEEVIRGVATVCEGVRRPVLVDIRELRSMSRECRKYFAGAETAKVESAVALLVVSPLTKAIGNFFMGINKTVVPTRLFTVEADAIVWLRGFLS